MEKYGNLKLPIPDQAWAYMEKYGNLKLPIPDEACILPREIW